MVVQNLAFAQRAVANVYRERIVGIEAAPGWNKFEQAALQTLQQAADTGRTIILDLRHGWRADV